MRIGFVSRYPPMHCGVAEYTRMLIHFLKSLYPDINVIVFTTTENGEEPWIDKSFNVKVIPCFKHATHDYSGLVDEIAYQGGVDILHVEHEYGIFGHTTWIIDAAVKARDEGYVKSVVFTMHTVYHPLSGRSYALYFQKSLNKLDAIIVHSLLQEFELHAEGVNTLKIHRIPHGTLINPYLGLPRNILAKKLGLNNSELSGIVLAIPGFLRPDKGIDVLFESISILGKSKCTVIVAGEVKDEKIKDMVIETSKEYNIIFIERYLSSDEILMIVGLADALVLPYKDKPGTFSVSGILHLSMGGLKPIIGARVPRLTELYQYAPRLTVPPENPHALAQKIRWLTSNYDYAVAYMATLYGYAARTQWARMARRHMRLYRYLLRSKKDYSSG